MVENFIAKISATGLGVAETWWATMEFPGEILFVQALREGRRSTRNHSSEIWSRAKRDQRRDGKGVADRLDVMVVKAMQVAVTTTWWRYKRVWICSDVSACYKRSSNPFLYLRICARRVNRQGTRMWWESVVVVCARTFVLLAVREKCCGERDDWDMWASGRKKRQTQDISGQGACGEGQGRGCGVKCGGR